MAFNNRIGVSSELVLQDAAIAIGNGNAIYMGDSDTFKITDISGSNATRTIVFEASGQENGVYSAIMGVKLSDLTTAIQSTVLGELWQFDNLAGLWFRARSTILTGGAFEAASITITAGATSSGNVTIGFNGTLRTAVVAAGDTAIAVADKIRATSFPGVTMGGTVGTATVTINYSTVGAKVDTTYSGGTTGSTGTATTTQQGSFPTLNVKGKMVY